MTAGRGTRDRAPVFVLGSPRSGTTLLYDMLLSAGGFAVYLAESNVFNVLALRFGNLAVKRNRDRLLRAWLDSKLFRATGLDSHLIAKKLEEECRSSGQFLQIVMSEIARQQGTHRWAENSPEAILHLPLIKKMIPNALVIHIIRDGRDVAMSLSRVKYVRPFPWEEQQGLLGAGLYWEWIVQQGRSHRQMLGPDYLEVHFEDLVLRPQATLAGIGRFIDHELDYERIRQVAYGSVSRPNTSFGKETPGKPFNPIGRWKSGFPPQQLAPLERMIGKTLSELGYSTSIDRSDSSISPQMHLIRVMHRTYFTAKLGCKRSRAIRALQPELTSAEIDATMLAEDHAPRVRNAISEGSR